MKYFEGENMDCRILEFILYILSLSLQTSAGFLLLSVVSDKPKDIASQTFNKLYGDLLLFSEETRNKKERDAFTEEAIKCFKARISVAYIVLGVIVGLFAKNPYSCSELLDTYLKYFYLFYPVFCACLAFAGYKYSEYRVNDEFINNGIDEINKIKRREFQSYEGGESE